MSEIAESWQNGGIEMRAQVADGQGGATWQFMRPDETFFAGRVRGGIAWPWPRRVGVRTMTQGAAVAVCVGLDGIVHAVGWGLCRAIAPSFGDDGGALQIGLSGLVRHGAARCDCLRWRSWSRADEANFGAVRALRSRLGGLGRNMAFSAMEGDVSPEVADRIITSMAEEGRLDIPDALAELIGREDASQTGLRPATEALAAAVSFAPLTV